MEYFTYLLIVWPCERKWLAANSGSVEWWFYQLVWLWFYNGTWFYTEKVELICRETFWCPEKCPEISNFFCPENKNFVCPGLRPCMGCCCYSLRYSLASHCLAKDGGRLGVAFKPPGTAATEAREWWRTSAICDADDDDDDDASLSMTRCKLHVPSMQLTLGKHIFKKNLKRVFK